MFKKVRQYTATVLGFQDCALFYEDPETSDLFTLTNLDTEMDPRDAVHPSSNNKRSSTAFAKELLFPEDSIVVFPSTIGMTGEVHKRSGVRFKNDFSKAVTQLQDMLDDA